VSDGGADARFPRARKGYDRAAVDAEIERLQDRIDVLMEQLRTAERDAGAPPPDAGAVLAAAEWEAAKITATAEADAHSRQGLAAIAARQAVERAEVRAEQIVAAAEEDVAHILARADRDAEGIVASAHRAAAQILRDAAIEAEAVIAEAADTYISVNLTTGDAGVELADGTGRYRAAPGPRL
jgi:cell division septum initiation protein DivIVA